MDYNSEQDSEIEVMKTIIKDDSIVVDVGARNSTIPHINNNASYYLFEPIQFNYNNLISEYNTFNNVKIYNLGLSNIEESRLIYLESESIHKRINFNYIWQFVNKERVQNGETEIINLITLNRFITENNINKIDLLKIDVEGFEYNVLLGLGDKLDIVDNIIFEYSKGTYESSNNTLESILYLLDDYKFYLINNFGIRFLGFNLEKINEELKNVDNCNILAKKTYGG
jgi:FkbM family methyltransferase